ncbi:MAG TPA: hypothetical protein DHW40_08670 [Microbacterium sp.]|nr:hypothetical protein [Microbacterium sp.]
MPRLSSAEDALKILDARTLGPDDLRRAGLTRHGVAAAVRSGGLLRLRQGRYATADTHPELLAAGRLGGTLGCVSLLATLGIFVHTSSAPHLHFERGTTRLPRRDARVTAHWRTARTPRHALAADLVEALAQAIRCQPPRHALATLESAWHQGFVDEHSVDSVFELLPRRFRPLRDLLDPRSESGTETLVRLMLRSLGCDIDVQVRIAGVGRVDFVVDGWLIIECDSAQHHSGWDAQRRDRRRDLAAAALGYTTVRPIAEDILFTPERVLHSLREAISRGPLPLRNSTRIPQRGR